MNLIYEMKHFFIIEIAYFPIRSPMHEAIFPKNFVVIFFTFEECLMDEKTSTKKRLVRHLGVKLEVLTL